jgi:hypothetical protein
MNASLFDLSFYHRFPQEEVFVLTGILPIRKVEGHKNKRKTGNRNLIFGSHA